MWTHEMEPPSSVCLEFSPLEKTQKKKLRLGRIKSNDATDVVYIKRERDNRNSGK